MKRARGADDGSNGANAPPTKKQNTNSGQMPKVQDALGYLEKVRTKFSSQPQVYNQFLDIMKDFKSQAIDTEGVIKRVKTLFKGNKSLILGFNQFLPPGYKIEVDEEAPAATQVEFSQAVTYVAKIKTRFKDQPAVYNEFLDILHEYQAKRTLDEVYDRVRKLFVNHPDLLDEFSYFLPDSDRESPLMAQPARAKQQKPKKKPAAERQESKKMPAGVVSTKDGKQRSVTFPAGSEKEIALFDKIKSSIPWENWKAFIRCLNLWTNRITTRAEMVRMVEDCLADRAAEFMDKFKSAIGFDEIEEKQLTGLLPRSNTAWIGTVEPSMCKQATPSYRQLPDDTPLPTCSGRTPLCDEVLNDRIVSIPVGSEDYSFKSTRKNVYEEALFKCEDDRFELDLLIENNAAAIRVLEPLVQQVQNLPPEQAKRVRLNKSVDILHLRAIARLYGENGYEVIELLKKSPATAAPVILHRLKQKDEEWRKFRIEMKAEWRKIASDNYTRSLDHRSFYFKQEDKKKRSLKVLMSELRDCHTKIAAGQTAATIHDPSPFLMDRKDEATAGYSMHFFYNDEEIHKQIYQVLSKLVASSFNDQEQLKFQLFWTGFVHHFFSVKNDHSTEQGLQLARAKAAQTRDNNSGGKPPSASMSPGRDTSGSGGEGMTEHQLQHLHQAQQEAQIIAAKTHHVPMLGPGATPGGGPEAMDEKGDEKDGQQGEGDGKDGSDEDGSDEGGAEGPTKKKGKKRKGGVKILRAKKGFDEEEDDEIGGSARGRRRLERQKKKQREQDDDDSEDLDDELETTFNGRTFTVDGDRLSDASNAAPGWENLAPFTQLGLFAAAEAHADENKDQQAARRKAQAADNQSGQVKPLKLSSQTWSMQEKFSPIRKHTRSSKLMFGNHIFYSWFRLHQILYERLLTAKQLAKSKKKPARKNPSSLPAAPDKYESFWRLLTQLMEDEIDVNRFEDETRTLLGASAYVLFTIDKVMKQLLRQTKSLVSSDTTLKLLCLYQYEFCRSREISQTMLSQGYLGIPEAKSLERSAQLARMYQANSAALMGDDASIQVEYFTDTHELVLGLVDSLPTSEPTRVTRDWAGFATGLLNDADKTPLKESDFVFRRYLNRNVRKVSSKFRGNWGDVEFNHGLELKLSMRNYKPQFEPDTSDWFARFRYKPKLKAIGVQVHKAVTDQQAASFDHWKRTRVDRRKRRRATGADRTRKILEKRLADLPVRSAGDQLMQEAAETLGLGAAARRSEMDLDR